MDNKKLFRNLSTDEWLHLGAFASGVFYVLLTIWTVLHLPLLTVVGVDFRAFFASAQIAMASGFAQVYDLTVQREVQKALMAPYTVGEIRTMPTLFLPVFIVPFIPFLPLGVLGGFALWTILNAGVLLIYLLRLAGGRGNRHLLLRLTLVSLPVFLTLLLGQVNVWLLVCVGEFLLAWERRRGFRGGLWLGGLLLKPQTLILLIPVLLLRRRWDILAGFTVAAIGIVAASLALAGPEGMIRWWNLIIRYSSMDSLPATNPTAMGNLRMLGELLSLLLPPWWAWGITGGLMVTTILLALWLSISRKRTGDEPAFLLPLLGATSAVAWHSHIHMAVILIPPLLHQVVTARRLSLFALWTLLPTAAYFLGITGMALLTALGKPLLPIPGLAYPALVLLGLHLYLVVRAIRRDR